MELGRSGIPKNATALLCHGILLKYIHYQSQRFHPEVVELGYTYQTLWRHKEFVELIPINTASIELKVSQPDVRVPRLIPIANLGLSLIKRNSGA